MYHLTDARGWQLREHTLKQLLGLPAKLPADLTLEPTLVGDTLVYVKAGIAGGRRSAGKHRVYAICNDCGKHVPAGRLHQHRKVHGATATPASYARSPFDC